MYISIIQEKRELCNNRGTAFFGNFYFMKIVLTIHWTCMCMYYIYFGCNNIKILKNQNSHKKELKIFKFWHKPSMKKVKGIYYFKLANLGKF